MFYLKRVRMIKLFQKTSTSLLVCIEDGFCLLFCNLLCSNYILRALIDCGNNESSFLLYVINPPLAGRVKNKPLMSEIFIISNRLWFIWFRVHIQLWLNASPCSTESSIFNLEPNDYSRVGFSLRLLELWKHEEFTASIESGEGWENYDSVLGQEKCISMLWRFPQSGVWGGLLLLHMLTEHCCITVPFRSRLLPVFWSIFWRMWVHISKRQGAEMTTVLTGGGYLNLEGLQETR